MAKKTLFNESWLEEEKYKPWLERDKNTMKTLLDANFVAQKFLFRTWEKERLKLTCKE